VILELISGPDDLAPMTYEELDRLSAEIRAFLIDKVSVRGGHLGPNLGTVELTIAVHRTFNSPKDVLIWDTGHQAYVHKILTGRVSGFDGLRSRGGLSGYPDRTESEHDFVGNSHASTSLSYADGLAKGFELQGENRHAVPIIGDGALTGGMAWEALNNIATSSRPIVIVLNDNGRSYSPTIGGISQHLSALRGLPAYTHFVAAGEVHSEFADSPVVDRICRAADCGTKEAATVPQAIFEDLGIKYIGPIDGHHISLLENALTAAKQFGGPTIVHCITEKGRGYAPAERDEPERFHAIGPINPTDGAPLSADESRSWTAAFGEIITDIADTAPNVVAITAAMQGPIGLNKMAARFPDRVFDVGIAEQHALTSAAGLAMAGMHPVVALYSTFLNRAFDQLLMDVALHDCGVTLVLDRAGITGPDGPSHHGMWDLSLLNLVPGIRIGVPRDEPRLEALLREAVAMNNGPTAIRYPKGQITDPIAPVDVHEGIDILYTSGRAPRTPIAGEVLIIAVGTMAPTAIEVAQYLADIGLTVTVIDPVWVAPISPALIDLAAGHTITVTIEDSGEAGGVGATVTRHLANAPTRARTIAIPQQFHKHASRSEIHIDNGLTPEAITRQILDWAGTVGTV
jgi:1-deoxy-D-xylulose-5-phosphate synthase